MDCQHHQLEASNTIVPSTVSIHVMVVDDDSTSLSIVSSLLKNLNYQVASFNDPLRALSTLRKGNHSFDLIVTSLYMSKMDGFELTKRVYGQFKLPVIMISTDDRESVMFRAIQEGVVLYLLKPFSPNDLRNIWQYVITAKSRSKPNPNLCIEGTRSHGVELRAMEAHSDWSSNEVMSEKKTKETKGRARNRVRGNDKKGLTKKKAKVIWTDFLQYRFLQAVQYIGLEKAVPKKILEVMNVPGLTRENVASHLQKYRIFLRKVAERCMISNDKKTEEVLWSKFLSRHASLVLEKIHRKRNLHLNSSESPNNPENSNPNDNGDPRSACIRTSYATDFHSYGPGHVANFAASLPMNQNNGNNNNAQGFNFSGAQFQTLVPFGNNYQGSNFSSNNNYYGGYTVGAGGEITMAGPMGVVSNNGNYVGFDGMGVLRGSEAIQRDEFGQFGIGIEGDNGFNWSLMCNNNGVNFGEDHTQITLRNSTQAHDNKDDGQQDSAFFASLFATENFVDNPTPNQQEEGNGDLMMKDQSDHLFNMYTSNEQTPTTSEPFSLDDKVLDEFFASLFKNDNSAEG